MNGVRGFGDRFPIPLPGGRNVFQQTYASGNTNRIVLPYHLDQSVGNAQRVSGTPHSQPDAQAAWDLGRMSAWPTSKKTQSMGYYTQQELASSSRWPMRSRSATPTTAASTAAPTPTACSTGPAPTIRSARTAARSSTTAATRSTPPASTTRGPPTPSACRPPA
jgi:hypothetical protein